MLEVKVLENILILNCYLKSVLQAYHFCHLMPVSSPNS